ncbi:hypothetical protein GCM10010317_097040 [Streptomyces mirabilis]|nr:hypothetical protein GCM10010317_097040 [Streptomyces mirabilis]
MVTHEAPLASPNPLAPVVHRRDGRPIYPILCASPGDDSNKPEGDGDAPAFPSRRRTSEGVGLFWPWIMRCGVRVVGMMGRPRSRPVGPDVWVCRS